MNGASRSWGTYRERKQQGLTSIAHVADSGECVAQVWVHELPVG